MRIIALSRLALISSAAVASLAACGTLRQAQGDTEPPIGSQGAMPQQQAAATRAASWLSSEATHSKIKHVVIVVQMGRTFNNLFEGYPGTVNYGYDSKGQKVKLRPISLATSWKLAANATVACNSAGSNPDTDCRMDGFNNEKWSCNKPGNPPCPIKYPPYSYVPKRDIRPYLDMASQYVLGDKMYASNFDASSFGSLQYIIAALDDGTRGYPSGVPGCGGGPHDWIKRIDGGRVHPCFDYTTLGDELDAAHLTWAYYESGNTNGICGSGSDKNGHASNHNIWIAYWAIKHICFGADWNSDVISPPKQFLTDVKSGRLRTVSWVTPTYQDSDLAGSGSNGGPSWVASVVNAVGESKYWNSTAIFVFWDGFGGWYDPQPPPYVDYDGLGFRVPLLVISPYAKQGYVSHVQYEHGSILKFAEDQFGLGRLAASDTRANSPATDCFDFNQRPRKFIPIKRI